MSVTSARAQAIAQILWELKKAEKLATLTSIANLAGCKRSDSQHIIEDCSSRLAPFAMVAGRC
jgi:hypothetical protein